MDQREQYFLEDSVKEVLKQIDDLPNQIQDTTEEIEEYKEQISSMEKELEHDYSDFGSKYYWQEDEKAKQDHDNLVEEIAYFKSELEKSTKDLEIKNEEIKVKIEKSSPIKDETAKAFDELNVLKEFEQEAQKEKNSYLNGQNYYLKQDNPELYNSRIRDIDEQLEEARAQIDQIYESLAKYKDKDLEQILNENSDIDLNHSIEDEQDRNKQDEEQDKIEEEQKKEQEADKEDKEDKEEQTKDEEKTNLDKKQLQDNLEKINEALKTYENLDEESPDFFEKLTAKQELLNKKEELENSLKKAKEDQDKTDKEDKADKKEEEAKVETNLDEKQLQDNLDKINEALKTYENLDEESPDFFEKLTAKQELLNKKEEIEKSIKEVEKEKDKADKTNKEDKAEEKKEDATEEYTAEEKGEPSTEEPKQEENTLPDKYKMSVFNRLKNWINKTFGTHLNIYGKKDPKGKYTVDPSETIKEETDKNDFIDGLKVKDEMWEEITLEDDLETYVMEANQETEQDKDTNEKGDR